MPGAPRPALLNSTSRRPKVALRLRRRGPRRWLRPRRRPGTATHLRLAGLLDAVSSRGSRRRPVIDHREAVAGQGQRGGACRCRCRRPSRWRLSAALLALVELLVLDQPAGKAEALEVEHGGQRFERRPRDWDRLAALDVVDDVADALLLEELLGFPGRVGFADDADLRVGGEAAPGAVRAAPPSRRPADRGSPDTLRVSRDQSGPLSAGSSSGCSTNAWRSSRVASTQSASGGRNTPPERTR